MVKLSEITRVDVLNTPIQSNWLRFYVDTNYEPVIKVYSEDVVALGEMIDQLLVDGFVKFDKYNKCVKSYEKDGTTYKFVKMKFSKNCKFYDENKKEILNGLIKMKSSEVRVIFQCQKYSYKNQNGISMRVHQVQMKPRKTINDVPFLFDE